MLDRAIHAASHAHACNPSAMSRHLCGDARARLQPTAISRHHGGVVSSIEISVVIAGAVWLFKQYPAKGSRAFLAFILATYVLYIGYAVLVWM